MVHRRHLSRHWTLLSILGYVVAIGGLGCGGTQSRNNGSSGGAGGGGGSSASGGTSSGGTTSGSGGQSGGPASGGAGGSSSSQGGTVGSSGSSGSSDSSGGGSGGDGTGGMGGSGGVASGGASGGPGGDSGGKASGGTGGSTVVVSCTGNGDCSEAKLVCETMRKVCVQCLTSSDCSSGGHCLGNQCVTYASCNDSRNCGNDQVCDTSRGLCFQCLAKADCASGQECVNNTCVAAPSCAGTSDCGGKVCDTDKKRCVECVADGDCKDSGQVCYQNTRRASCMTDKVCTPKGMLCDLPNSICVQCKSTLDCPSSFYCASGLCTPDVCDQTLSKCSGSGVSACNTAGSGWDSSTTCDDANPCKAIAGVASCGGKAQPDAAISSADGGNASVDGGVSNPDGSSDAPLPPACTTDKATPCTGLPKFAGVQTVDGVGDDLCSVPSFTFTKAAAAKVNNYNTIPDSQFESVVARVAWSPLGLHAFFDVTDASVQSVNTVDVKQALTRSHQGDSIEIYISSSDTLTGLTSADSNALHVIVPATGPAVSVKTDNGGGGTPTELPAGQYKQAKTSGGYAIEVLLPWPGGAPSGESQVRFDLAINSADATFGGLDDMRDAQVIYYVGTGGGSPACGTTSEPYCDDRLWCATTLQP